jgi:hypothetical protein
MKSYLQKETEWNLYLFGQVEKTKCSNTTNLLCHLR